MSKPRQNLIDKISHYEVISELVPTLRHLESETSAKQIQLSQSRDKNLIDETWEMTPTHYTTGMFQKFEGYDWKWKAMLIQNNLTSGAIYVQLENINNTFCVFFYMTNTCPIEHELVRNPPPWGVVTKHIEDIEVTLDLMQLLNKALSKQLMSYGSQAFFSMTMTTILHSQL